MDVMCTTCYAGGCAGVHDFCLECDGSKKVTCPRCTGDGIVYMPARQVACPDCDGAGCGECEDSGTVTEEKEIKCPDCKGTAEITCPACKGTGKPRRSAGPPEDTSPPGASPRRI